MLERLDAVKALHKGTIENFEARGFTFSEITEDGGTVNADFTKGDVTVRLSSHENLLDVLEKTGDGEFTKASAILLELSTADERDIKSISNEINETVNESFGEKAASRTPRQAQKTVSRADVRAGMSYDGNTLASKIVLVYPELKEAYKENSEKYDQFLSEDFFVNHANEKILATVKSGDAATRKKLFKILVDMYQNGSGETQDLICVTILGEINNDKDMMQVCRNYIDDDDFYETLEAVNRLLASKAGKKLREKMANPPKYKPKKKKGLMGGNMFDGSTMMTPPQM